MVKFMGLLKRKPGMTREEFWKHWREVHAPLVLRTTPGLRRYVLNPAVILPSGREFQYDGIVEIWYDNLEALREVRKWESTPDGKAVIDDGNNFIDHSKSVNVVVEETVIKA